MDNSAKKHREKPDYVLALEVIYGLPSQSGYGSAIFFDNSQNDDLEELAKTYYQHFVGAKWTEWGEETWMAPWKEVYLRTPDASHDIVMELQGIDDGAVAMSVSMLLTNIDNVTEVIEAVEDAYNDRQVADLRVFEIGDGGAMSGLILAGRRDNGEAIFLVFLMD